jgi:predicted DNA-binding protein
MKSEKPVAMRIDPEQLRALRRYSEATGVPVARVLREALAMWIGEVMPVRMKALQNQG